MPVKGREILLWYRDLTYSLFVEAPFSRSCTRGCIRWTCIRESEYACVCRCVFSCLYVSVRASGAGSQSAVAPLVPVLVAMPLRAVKVKVTTRLAIVLPARFLTLILAFPRAAQDIRSHLVCLALFPYTPRCPTAPARPSSSLFVALCPFRVHCVN